MTNRAKGLTLEDLFNYRRKGAGNLVDAYEQLQARCDDLERENAELRRDLDDAKSNVNHLMGNCHRFTDKRLAEHDAEVARKAFIEGSSWANVYCLDETSEEAAERYIERTYGVKDGGE